MEKMLYANFELQREIELGVEIGVEIVIEAFDYEHWSS